MKCFWHIIAALVQNMYFLWSRVHITVSDASQTFHLERLSQYQLKDFISHSEEWFLLFLFFFSCWHADQGKHFRPPTLDVLFSFPQFLSRCTADISSWVECKRAKYHFHDFFIWVHLLDETPLFFIDLWEWKENSSYISRLQVIYYNDFLSSMLSVKNLEVIYDELYTLPRTKYSPSQESQMALH